MIEAIERPEGKREYQFFRNSETGHRFKVKMTSRPVGPVRVNPLDISSQMIRPDQLAVCLTISMIDAEDKAIQDSGLPIIDSHTHTFTSVETADPGFILQQRIATILQQRIAAMEGQYALRGAATAMQNDWMEKPLIMADIAGETI